MSAPTLDRIAATGNRSFKALREQQMMPPNQIRCIDGFRLSVIAGEGTYCIPRPGWGLPNDYAGPYTHVEVGYPSEKPEPWHCSAWHEGFDDHDDHEVCDGWEAYCESPDDPTGTVYAYVPVAMVRALIASHGGEA